MRAPTTRRRKTARGCACLPEPHRPPIYAWLLDLERGRVK